MHKFSLLFVLGLMACGDVVEMNETKDAGFTDAGLSDASEVDGGEITTCDLTDWQTACGTTIRLIPREEWGVPLKTQNEGALLPSGATLSATSTREIILEAIRAEIYPPYVPWPESIGFPMSYNVGDELNWPETAIDWPVREQMGIHVLVAHYTAGGVEPADSCDGYKRVRSHRLPSWRVMPA